MRIRSFPVGAALLLAVSAITPASAFSPVPFSRVASLAAASDAADATLPPAQILLAAKSGGEGQGPSGTSSGNGPGPRPSTALSTSDDPDGPGVDSPLLPPSFPGLRGGQPGDPLDQVGVLSQQAQSAIRACRVDTPACMADALDIYADRLEALTPRLGPRYRELPIILRRAARKVRAAKSDAAAANAVKSAITEVNKTIALLAAEDPNATRTGAAVARAVDQTLEVAEVKLTRSTDM